MTFCHEIPCTLHIQLIYCGQYLLDFEVTWTKYEQTITYKQKNEFSVKIDRYEHFNEFYNKELGINKRFRYEMQCNSSAIHITYLLEGQYLKLKLKYMLKYLPHDKRSSSHQGRRKAWKSGGTGMNVVGIICSSWLR